MISDSYGAVTNGCGDTYIVWEYFNRGYMLVHTSVRTVLQWKSESAILIPTVHIHGVGMACLGCIL